MQTMRPEDIISLISRVRDNANKFITGEMNRWGIKGLAPSHGDILFSLLNSETMTMKDLAKKIDKDKSTVTALVDKLIKLGYVKKSRDEKDNRIVFVTLTESGRNLKPMFDSISHDLIEKIYKDIPQAEKEALILTLEKIKKNF